MRLTVAKKLWIGFGLLILIIVVTDLIINRSIESVEQRLLKVTEVEEPTSAAAYEMEINVIGTGLGVFKYLETGDPQYRARVADDEADFDRYKSEYDRLSNDEQERALGIRIGALFDEYKALGESLMNARDAKDEASDTNRQAKSNAF